GGGAGGRAGRAWGLFFQGEAQRLDGPPERGVAQRQAEPRPVLLDGGVGRPADGLDNRLGMLGPLRRRAVALGLRGDRAGLAAALLEAADPAGADAVPCRDG